MDKKDKPILETIWELIDFLLTSRVREQQSNLELNMFEFAKMIKEKKESYFAQKFPLDKEKNEKFVEIRGGKTSDLTTTRIVNKLFANKIIDLQILESEIEILESHYKALIRICNHINDRFIQDNVDNKRNVH